MGSVGPADDLEVRVERGTAPALVFLHEGLGSLGLWRGFPDAVRSGLGLPAMVVYSRSGYGRSPVRSGPWPDDFMHHEAEVVLPELLRAHKIDRPILVGHSDGASIALLHASRFPVTAVVSIAAHVFVEDVTVASIAALREFGLRDRLGRHHVDAGATFDAWTDVWLRPSFRTWDITARLMDVTCPVLAIQGAEDEYGTSAQLDAIESGVAGPCTRRELDGLGHAPHAEAHSATVHAIVTFLRGVGP